MKKKYLLYNAYWISILIVLTLIFGFSWKSYRLAFNFSLLLLPVVILTTYVFTSYLVPKYLLKGHYEKFALYFFYLLIVSLYLEMLVSVFSFVVIAEANQSLVDLEGISIFTLGITLYLIVFATSFIKLFIAFKKREQLVENLQTAKERNEQQTLSVRADRKNQLVSLDQLIYIESLSDYVKIVTTTSELTTREKISGLAEKLPDHFIRIHRSFIVNAEKIVAFTTTEVNMPQTTLPISRTYKKEAIAALEKRHKEGI